MGYEDEDPAMVKELEEEIHTFEKVFEKLKIQTLLSGEYDACNAIMTIHAGAGGTESCDWAGMLYRMYCRWAERKGFSLQVLDFLDGDIAAGESEEGLTDRSLLDMKSIWDFANTVDIEDIREVIGRQIEYNSAIADEGLKGNYGANIGSVLLDTYGNDVRTRAKARAAAGSDARMNGCELPVVINAGSGNQGMTCSLPVLEYADELQSGEEKTYRALVLSNLVAIHQKTGIGRLSAYCGAVSAGAAAGAGIAYLCGGGYEEVIHTVVNALAIVSGMVCDGAKASCAAKIASSVDAGILGYNMYLRGQQFYAGDGIVTKGVEATIQNIGRLGKDGMKETNEEIIKMMISD